MKVADFAILDLRRRPVSTLAAIIGVGLMVAIGSFLLTLQASVYESFERVDPGVTTIIAPKSSALEAFLGGLHFGGYRIDDLLSETSIMTNLNEEVHPAHAMAIARFAHAGKIPVTGVGQSYWQRPEGIWAPQMLRGDHGDGVASVVIGFDVANRYGLEIGSALDVDSDLSNAEGAPVWQKTYAVSGILKQSHSAIDRAAFVPIEDARQAYAVADLDERSSARTSVAATHILAHLNSPQQYLQMYEIVTVRRAEQLVHTEIFLQRARRMLGMGERASTLIRALLILIAASLIGVLLHERFGWLKSRLGVLQALGYTRDNISAIFALQGLVIALGGIITGAVTERMISSFFFQRLSPAWLFEASFAAAGHTAFWAGIFVAVLVFSMLPVFWLGRTNPHDALRGV